MHLPLFCRSRALLAMTAVLLLLIGAPGASAQQAPPPDESAAHAPAAASHEADEAHDSLLPTIAKIFNFALLVGALVYYLRPPIARYLNGRSETVRKDLLAARELRSRAEAQLGAVRTQLAALPAEIEALRLRGSEDLSNERARMKEATVREREKMLETTRREIDRQVRGARRALAEQTADLAMRVARRRIETTITVEDQQRLIDRYAAGVHQ